MADTYAYSVQFDVCSYNITMVFASLKESIFKNFSANNCLIIYRELTVEICINIHIKVFL